MAGPTELRVLEDVSARNIRLTVKLMRYLMSQPAIVQSLPPEFELVLLPGDDPELRAHSLALLDHPGIGQKPLVIVRMLAAAVGDLTLSRSDIFVPLAV